MLALFLLQVLLVSFHVDDDIKWNYSDRKSTSEKSSIASSYLHLSVWVRETSSTTILFLQHSDSDKKNRIHSSSCSLWGNMQLLQQK